MQTTVQLSFEKYNNWKKIRTSLRKVTSWPFFQPPLWLQSLPHYTCFYKHLIEHCRHDLMMYILHSALNTAFGAQLCEIFYAGTVKNTICWQWDFSGILWGKEYRSGWDSHINWMPRKWGTTDRSVVHIAGSILRPWIKQEKDAKGNKGGCWKNDRLRLKHSKVVQLLL